MRMDREIRRRGGVERAGVERAGDMRMRKLVVALAAGVVAVLLAGPALAQQVLACFTLHNDLANFDRRAHRPPFAAEREAAWQSEQERAAEQWRLQRWARSRLGGSDPVRLAIIDEMYRNGCPLPPEVALLAPPPRTVARPHGRKKPPLRVLGQGERRTGARPPG